MHPTKIITHEEMVAGAELGSAERTTIVFSLCGRGETDRKTLARAVLAWRRIEATPTTVIIIHVAGYDDDPRELWQIDEVCRFVAKFCARTKAHEHPALDPMSKAVLLACGGDPTVRPIVHMTTVEESLTDFDRWVKDRLK